MKSALAILVVLAVSGTLDAWTVPRTGTGVLADELQSFVDVIPLKKMLSIVLQYMANDAEFQTLIGYLHSTEFKNLVTDIEAIPEVLDLLNYIQGAGVDVYYLVNKLNAYIGIPLLKAPQMLENFKITGGIRGFLDDIEAIYPKQAIRDLYRYKMANSKVFADFMARLRSPATQKIADAIVVNPNFKALVNKAIGAGIKVEDIKDFLQRFLNITIHLV